MLYYKNFLYILKIIKIKFISQHNNDLVINYIEVEKPYGVIVKKYY